jgi:tetratricopeptide (TPR) repeat protein
LIQLEKALQVEKRHEIYIDVGDALVALANIKFHNERYGKHADPVDIGLEQEERRRKKYFEEAKTLIFKAVEQYKAAQTADPSYLSPYPNWGKHTHYQSCWQVICIACALFDLGEITQSLGKESEAEDYFNEACRMFAAAEDENPSDYLLLNDWGRALYERAKMTEGGYSQNFLNQSVEKYSNAWNMVASKAAHISLHL